MGQRDLLNLQQPVLLVANLTDLIMEVVQSSVHKPAHQCSKDSAEDSGGDKDCRVALDPKVVGLHQASVHLLDVGQQVM